MQYLLLLFVVCCVSLTVTGKNNGRKNKVEDDDDADMDDDAVIEFVNKGDFGWKAGKDPKTHGKSKRFKKQRLGFRDAKPVFKKAPGFFISNQERERRQTRSIPTSFDARLQWSRCASRIEDIRDQGQCGSCWAHALASVISDRLCISKGLTTVKISAQDLINCMNPNYIEPDFGTDLCKGFDHRVATRMAINEGIVTGGDFNEAQGCKPYRVETHNNGTSGGLQCPKSCSNSGYGKAYLNDKWKCTSAALIGHFLGENGNSVNLTYIMDGNSQFLKAYGPPDSVERQIQWEIMNYGPVAAAMHVYKDFENYLGGVYRKSDAPGNAFLSGHIIKLIGWGVDSIGRKYWTAVNSWSERWGLSGMFFILRGVDEVKIESYVVSPLFF